MDITPIEAVHPLTITGVDQRVCEYWYLPNLMCAVIHRSGISGFISQSVPSEPIREQIDLSNRALKSSLIALKSTAALAERIPYLPVLATLLLQVLTTQDASI